VFGLVLALSAGAAAALAVAFVPEPARADGGRDERGGGTIVPVPIPGRMDIAPDRGEGGRYRDGDAIAFTLDLPASGYLTVYEVGPDGSVHVIFPHAWDRDPYVRAGRIDLPESGAGWRYQVDAPSRGVATVVAVLSPDRHATPVWLPGVRLGATAPEADAAEVLAARAAEVERLDRRVVCGDGCGGPACGVPRCPWPRVFRASTWIRVAPAR
jgi:hypothetical protein